MRIGIDIDLGVDRIRARLRRDGTVLFDDEAVVALRANSKGRAQIVAIGEEARSAGAGTALVAAVVSSRLNPAVAASLARYAALKSLGDLRPGWRQLLLFFDRVDVSVAIEGYDRLTPDQRREFVEHLLPYRTQVHWWFGGREVKFSPSAQRP